MDTIATLTMNPSVDVAATVERLLPNQKLRSPTRLRYPGGGGVNVTRVIKDQGADACAVVPIGGGVGEVLTELLDKQHIDYHAVRVGSDTRENFVVQVTEEDALYHFVTPGVQLSSAEADRCLTELEALKPRPHYLVASGSLPPGVDDNFYGRVANLAQRCDMRLIVDASGPSLAAIRDHDIYLIKCNQREFTDLYGESLADEFPRRCQQLQGIVAGGRVEILVVTLGDEGAIAATHTQQLQVRPPRVEIKSPVGAGDSFVGLLTFKLAQGATLQEALSYGVAAAASAVTTGGTELCRKDDVARLYEKIMADDSAIQLFDHC